MSVRDNSCGIADLQDKMLDILKYTINICDQNNLTYWVVAGTLLGAVRHGGFIPWDDDLDIHMPRQDYERLWKLKGKDRTGRYVLCRTTKNRNYHHRVMQMVDTETTFIHTRCADEDIEHGVYIDIIPIDVCPENKIAQIAQMFHASLFSIYNIQCKPEYNGNKAMAVITDIMLRILPNKKLRYKVWKSEEKRMLKYSFDKKYASSKYLKVITATMKELKHPFPKEWFGNRKIAFEDIEVNIPSNAEAYLTAMYGDYMQLPPEEKRVVRHNTIYIDLNTPYKKYKGIYYCKK